MIQPPELIASKKINKPVVIKVLNEIEEAINNSDSVNIVVKIKDVLSPNEKFIISTQLSKSNWNCEFVENSLTLHNSELKYNLFIKPQILKFEF